MLFLCIQNSRAQDAHEELDEVNVYSPCHPDSPEYDECFCKPSSCDSGDCTDPLSSEYPCSLDDLGCPNGDTDDCGECDTDGSGCADPCPSGDDCACYGIGCDDGNDHSQDNQQEPNLDNQISDECLKTAVNNVINAGVDNPFSKIINGSEYQGEDGVNLSFVQYSDSSTEGVKVSASMNGGQYNQNINLNLAALNYAPDEYVMAIIYHEIIHAHLRNEGVSSSNNGHHEAILADWFDIISNQLQEDFPNLSQADADALTWGGLGNTNKWVEMNDKDINNNTGITGDIVAINTKHKNVNNINGGNYGTRQQCD